MSAPENHDKPPDAKPAGVPELLVQSEHRLRLDDGSELEYQAVCGQLPLRELDQGKDDASAKGEYRGDKTRASIFFIAYSAKSGPAGRPRPLCFSFNGGPGSSSVWLHLGILGPQRVTADEMGDCGAPPYALEPNRFSLLAEADLVFIDPVGTGLSRMAEGEKAAEFHDFQRDLDAVGEFIRLYLTRWNRWGSPIYLIGESYGTTRAAGLARHLQEKHDVQLNGLMLVSLALDFQTLSFDPGNELPCPLYLPTYAATAWYHQALAPAQQAKSLAVLVKEAEDFANGDYWLGLMQGARLAPERRHAVAERMAALTGLSTEYLLRCDLRPTEFRFFKELLRTRGQVVGRLDSRFLGQDRDDAGEHPEEDPGMNNLVGAYATGINRVLREQLGWVSDQPYVVHAPLWKTWSWKGHENKYLSAGDCLRRAMQANPAMRVYVASGYYDLATPHAAGDYTLAHLGLREPLQRQIQVSYFEAGHMMYIHRPSLERMAAELRSFVRGQGGDGSGEQ